MVQIAGIRGQPEAARARRRPLEWQLAVAANKLCPRWKYSCFFVREVVLRGLVVIKLIATAGAP